MLIPIAEIKFTPSQDIDEDQLIGIADSIKEKGLSHSIIVRRENSSYMLVSGEKRLLAAQRIGWTEIPAEIRDVSESEGEEIRLHENLKRFNLPWWEQVVLVERLHTLRQAKHGPAATGRPAKTEVKGWSIRDTAKELQVGVGPLSEDLGLARFLRSNPELKKVKDKKTAIRLMRIAADRQEAESEATLPSARTQSQIFEGDAVEILKQLPANSVHHCITDPPWIKFFDPKLTIDERTLPVFRELYRVLKHGAFLYVFGGLDDYGYYAGVDEPHYQEGVDVVHKKGELEKIGFTVSKTPILWQKINSLSRRGVASWEYDRDFEFIILAVKGSPALTTGRKLSSIKSFPIVHPTKMIHPNEKPVDLVRDLIDDCSYEGQLIIDPFAGSGVLGEACKGMKRNYYLIERDHESFVKIQQRLGYK